MNIKKSNIAFRATYEVKTETFNNFSNGERYKIFRIIANKKKYITEKADNVHFVISGKGDSIVKLSAENKNKDFAYKTRMFVKFIHKSIFPNIKLPSTKIELNTLEFSGRKLKQTLAYIAKSATK